MYRHGTVSIHSSSDTNSQDQKTMRVEMTVSCGNRGEVWRRL